MAPQFFTADTVHRIGREPRCGFAAWIAPSQVVHRGVLLLLAASGALACREWWYRRVRRFLVIKSCHQDDVPEYFDVLYFGCSSHQNGHQIVRPKIAQNECSSHPGGFSRVPPCASQVFYQSHAPQGLLIHVILPSAKVLAISCLWLHSVAMRLFEKSLSNGVHSFYLKSCSPDSESYWGPHFKLRKRCLCALWSLGAAGCRCQMPMAVGALEPAPGAAAGFRCEMSMAVCALEGSVCCCCVRPRAHWSLDADFQGAARRCL